jgi:ABC-type branched-subunit amino acid transport system substrate-binding protein
MSRDDTPPAGSDGCNRNKRYVSRRSLLAGTSALTLGGLAGCSQNNDGNGGNGDSNGDTNTDDNGNGGGSTGSSNSGLSITIGSPTPLSGPFSQTGENIHNGIDLAAKHAEERGLADEVTVLKEDSETAPGPARQRAQEMINDGADMIVGTVSGSSARAVSDLGRQEQVIVCGASAAIVTTGEECHPYWFPNDPSVYTYGNGGIGHVFREGMGDNLFTISSDFIYPQSFVRVIDEYLSGEWGIDYNPENDNIFTGFGQSDYSQALTEFQNSDKDVLAPIAFGSDMVNLLNQAWEFGLPQDGTIIAAPTSSLGVAEGTDPDMMAHENVFQSTLWWPWTDTPDAKQLMEDHIAEFDRPTGSYGGSMYAHTLSFIEAMANAGTTNASEVVDDLKGGEIAVNLWREDLTPRYRECNNRPTVPTPVMKGKPASEVEGSNYFEILNMQDDLGPNEFMLDCAETGCNMGG